MVTTVNARRLEEQVGPRGCDPSWPDHTSPRSGRGASGFEGDPIQLWLIRAVMALSCPQ